MVNVSDLLDTAYGQLAVEQHSALTEIKTVTLYCLSQICKSLTKPRGSKDQSYLRKEAPGQVMLYVDPVGTSASSSY